MLDVAIRNARVVGGTVADVGIVAGKIVPGGGAAKAEIDATGLTLLPGVIDSHVHFNEPGRTEWEGIASGSAALAAGGGTCFFDMPLNSSPPTLDGKSFDLKLAAASANSRTDFGLWGGLTPKNLGSLEELADRGVVGFKAFMSGSGIDDFSAADDYTLWRGMKVAAERGLVVAVHAENDSITAMLSVEMIRSRRVSAADYLASRPVVAEVEAISRVIVLARETGCKLHVVHVSSEAGAKVIEAAEDVDVTYETCPHYWLLTGDELPKLGAAGKCAPPLRNESDAKYLAGSVRGGGLAFVASDHSPAPAWMKTGDDFFKIWGGISGVQSTLAAVLSIDPPVALGRVAAVVAGNVAGRFGIVGKGRIAEGFDADLVLVDLNESVELRTEDLLDRHRLSPYVGRRFRGKIRRTILGGRTVFSDGKIDDSVRGRWVKPGNKI